MEALQRGRHDLESRNSSMIWSSKRLYIIGTSTEPLTVLIATRLAFISDLPRGEQTLLHKWKCELAFFELSGTSPLLRRSRNIRVIYPTEDCENCCSVEEEKPESTSTNNLVHLVGIRCNRAKLECCSQHWQLTNADSFSQDTISVMMKSGKRFQTIALLYAAMIRSVYTTLQSSYVLYEPHGSLSKLIVLMLGQNTLRKIHLSGTKKTERSMKRIVSCLPETRLLKLRSLAAMRVMGSHRPFVGNIA